MPTSDYQRLRDAISKFKNTNILVIGDLIIDHFIWGTDSRFSPEAPVPVVNVTRENRLLGGSANVLHNLYELGSQSTICGVIGNDDMGAHLLELVSDLSSPLEGIIKVKDRPTTIQTRLIAQNQQVVRFDKESTGEVNGGYLESIKAFIDKQISTFDAIIVSDYAKGIINNDLMSYLRNKLSDYPDIPLVIDPKPSQPERFMGATIITPNHHEAERMSGIDSTDDAWLMAAGNKLLADLDSTAVLITRGEAGMTIFEHDKPMKTIPTVAKEVFDVTGAGDTVIATLALSLAAKLSFSEAASLANFAAGIVVGKVGTATVRQEEILKAMP